MRPAAWRRTDVWRAAVRQNHGAITWDQRAQSDGPEKHGSA